MAKIHQTLALLQAGARANKYRITYPVFGRDIDIACISTSMPGRSVSVTEVMVKGRKFRLAGEMEEEGSWEMTIHNTDDHLHRRFFLKLLDGIHNFMTPGYLHDGGDLPTSELQSFDNFGVTAGKSKSSGAAQAGSSLDGLGNFLGGVNSTISKINRAYNDVKNLFSTGQRIGSNIKNAANGGFDSFESIVSAQGYNSSPWYMSEVKIQQLDHNDMPTATVIMHNCFVSLVGPVEYGDDSSNQITTTSITFTYSGLSFGDYSELPAINIY